MVIHTRSFELSTDGFAPWHCGCSFPNYEPVDPWRSRWLWTETSSSLLFPNSHSMEQEENPSRSFSAIYHQHLDSRWILAPTLDYFSRLFRQLKFSARSLAIWAVLVAWPLQNTALWGDLVLSSIGVICHNNFGVTWLLWRQDWGLPQQLGQPLSQPPLPKMQRYEGEEHYCGNVGYIYSSRKGTETEL